METYVLHALAVFAGVFTTVLLATLAWRQRFAKQVGKRTPVSVNYHFTRKCNYECGFCFHTAKTSFVLPLDEAKRGLLLLKEAGMKKLNFAGGEPLLRKYRQFLGELIRYAKEELLMESLSIVSNGSQIDEKWFADYGRYIDILAISCDSFEEEVNKKIGRGKGAHLRGLYKARDICLEHNIKFKINTVVNAYNWEEDMNKRIRELDPARWKCFQVLKLDGENSGKEGDRRDVSRFLISTEQFQEFCKRHQGQACLVPESNEAMKNSYLILDENMAFLNCTDDGKEPTESLLQVGVARALDQSGWDDRMFQSRGGIYDWTRSQQPEGEEPVSCTSQAKELEW